MLKYNKKDQIYLKTYSTSFETKQQTDNWKRTHVREDKKTDV